MNKIQLTVLEYNEGEYQGSKYSSIMARNGKAGKILKYKLDTKKVGNLAELVDRDVEATIDIVAGANNLASIKVVDVKPL